MDENAVARQIVDAAYRVHTTLGPGLLESVYEAALAYEWEKRGLRVSRQQAISVVYEAVRIHTGFFADLIVEDAVIVEIQALEAVAPVHKKQLLTYLKLADKRLGLPINFNAALIKLGITRIVKAWLDHCEAAGNADPESLRRARIEFLERHLAHWAGSLAHLTPPPARCPAAVRPLTVSGEAGTELPCSRSFINLVHTMS